MAHYVVVLTPDGLNEWLARLPDFPGCRATSTQPDIATNRAAANTTDLVQQLRAKKHYVPNPRSLTEIKTDPNWASDRKVNWDDAVISSVEVPT